MALYAAERRIIDPSSEKAKVAQCTASAIKIALLTIVVFLLLVDNLHSGTSLTLLTP
jgi:hypothetical protein